MFSASPISFITALYELILRVTAHSLRPIFLSLILMQTEPWLGVRVNDANE